MGFPSVMYIILNINEQAPRFPSISGLTIGNDTDLTLWLVSASSWVLIGWEKNLYRWKGLINGLYDASAGIFLTFKFVYDSDAGVDLTTLLIGFACATSLIWIKLFFFIPYKETDPNLTVFESSVFGQFCNKDKFKDEEVDDKISETKEKKESIPVMNSILTINYLLVRVFISKIHQKFSKFSKIFKNFQKLEKNWSKIWKPINSKYFLRYNDSQNQFIPKLVLSMAQMDIFWFTRRRIWP